MKFYAVKFNNTVFLRSRNSMLDQTMVTNNAADIHFFNDFEKATKVAENVGGYVIAFTEEDGD